MDSPDICGAIRRFGYLVKAGSGKCQASVLVGMHYLTAFVSYSERFDGVEADSVIGVLLQIMRSRSRYIISGSHWSEEERLDCTCNAS